jgi:hypothetical protein
MLVLLVPAEGLEPPTNGLQNRCSTAELSRQKQEMSLYRWLLALQWKEATAHVTRTSKAVQITVQNLSVIPKYVRRWFAPPSPPPPLHRLALWLPPS